MGSSSTLVANGNITGIDTSGYQTLETTDVTLTASQFAGFSSIISGSDTGGWIYGATGGTYDLEGKSTLDYTLIAQSNAGTTLIGNDANGEGLTASASGTDTLQAGNGSGDQLFAGGGADKLIAGNGGDRLYIGSGVDTAIGGNGGDTFVIGEDDGATSVAAGTSLQGGTGNNTLIVSEPIVDISDVTISGIQTLEAQLVALTASQFAGFTSIITGTDSGGTIYGATGGAYDLEGKSTEDFTLTANSNAGTTLIGNDANGEILTASASGTDSLQAGNGNGDSLYAGGGTDTLIAGDGTGDQLNGGAGTDIYILSNTGTATVTGGSGTGIAEFSGSQSNYTLLVTLASGSFDATVANKSTGAVDTLKNVQLIQFAGGQAESLLSAAGGPLALITDPGVKADVASVLVNDSLSYAGMLTLLQDVASQGTVTASEFSSLQTLASLLNLPGGISASTYVQDIATSLIDGDPANQFWTGGGTAVALGNLAAGSSATQLDELIGKWFLGTDLPSIQGFSAQYENDTNPLFGKNGVPVYTDANQGELGDCYLIASLGEIALLDPESIESMITSDGNGIYGVRFYVGGQPEYVTVNTELPYFSNGDEWANGSTLVFANGSPIWAALIEKAYVELNAEPGATGETQGNTYSLIASGDATPITLITGKQTSFYEYDEYGSEASWASSVQSIAASAFTSGEEVLVGTGDTISDPSRFVSDHMFEVIGYNASTSLFTLYNPWGSDYSGTDPSVTFTASMADIYNNEGTFYVASGQALLPSIPATDNFTGGNTSDILGWNPSTGVIGDFVMNNGVAEPFQDVAWVNPSSGWQVVGSGNFYGAASDVLLANSSGQIGEFEMSNNTATWQGLGLINSGAGWAVAGTGDFYGNGTDDILLANQSAGQIGEFKITNGAASWQGIGTVGSGWAVAGTGDFFGNGTDDILLANQSAGEIGMFDMYNGVATWQGIGTVNASAGWAVAGTGDFFGNGTEDILLANSKTGALGMFAMHNGQATWQSIGTVGAGWQVTGTGDYFGNGTSDILLQNATTGGIGMFAMNNGVASWQGIATLPAGWHIS